MTVAFICGRDIEFAGDTDGGSVLIRNLARELGACRHSVDIFTPENLTGSTYRVKGRLAPHGLAGVTMRRFPVRGSAAELAPLNESGSYFRNRIVLSERMAEYFADGILEAYDRIYIFHIANAFGIVANGSCPIERTVLFPMLLGAAYAQFETVPPEYLLAERATLARVQHIAAASAAEAAMLQTAYDVPLNKTLIMQRGYDPDVFVPLVRAAVPRDRTHIICANTIRPQKNQRFFLEFVEEARARLPGLVVHLVGLGQDNPQSAYGVYARTFAADIKKRSLSPYFALHPVMPQRGVARLMRECDLSLYPSYTETFGKSVLESVVSGLPTVAFNDVPAYGECIESGYTGMLVPRSVEAAVAAVEELRANAALYRALSTAGIAEANRFAWPVIVHRFLYALEARVAS